MPNNKTKFYINAVSLYRFYSLPIIKKTPYLSKVFEGINYLIFNCSIPASVIIGKGTFFSHRGMSVVLHKNCVIGDNCIIGTCVTLGGKGKGIEGAPIIGDRVVVSTGAKLLGGINIGDDAVIGANSVVLHDVPKGMTAVGIPARITKGMI
jgi:serine O-acetyltransferase